MINIEYIKAGYINNMSAKGTYDQIYHLRRLLSRASKEGDSRARKVYSRMLVYYLINEPELTHAALRSHIERGW